ncbi:MAG: type IV toxin-antitoxin system AbiEi family antitoxin domain-containing protein [Rhodospirillales bacterium]|nr:type IV toxin-antitoxin system AbiEi family antitoxin domain-containing protein [Acetobacter sp.]
MGHRDVQQARRALHTVATTQGGYFTAKQASEAGYGNRHPDYHAKAENFERVGRGLYRLPMIPLDEQDELIRLSLWSRDRHEQPQAVASYDTALAFHQLSDVLPVRLHVTVPLSFRKLSPSATVVLHKAVLAVDDVQEAAGFRITNPKRTLLDVADEPSFSRELDVADEPSFSREQLDRALADAVERGLVQRSWLRVMSQHFASRLA